MSLEYLGHASVLLISKEKISLPAISMKGVSSPSALAIPMLSLKELIVKNQGPYSTCMMLSIVKWHSH